MFEKNLTNSFFKEPYSNQAIALRIKEVLEGKVGFYSVGLYPASLAYNWAMQDKGLNTIEANEALGFAADERDYSYCKEILSSVGVSSVKLMTNNPAKIKGLEDVGIEVSERISIEIEPNEHNEDYLKIKAKYMGHMLTDSD